MNDNFSNTNEDNTPITPYRATGNLNTVISNPSANINDTMNINIQNISTPTNQAMPEMKNEVNQNAYSNVSLESNINENNTSNFTNPTNVSNPSQSNVESNIPNKKYVSLDNKPKKKTVSIKIGSELKIVLLIVVILLVFIFLFPIISDLFTKH